MYGHCHNLGLTVLDRKGRGVEDAQNILSAKINNIFYAKRTDM
jgi:hypothetical protein